MDVLLVDDHPLFTAGMRCLLHGLDNALSMDEENTCEDALNRLKTAHYDLLLLDLNLPGIQFMGALDRLRAAAPDTAIVVITAEDDPRIVRDAIEHGALGFIPKSSTPDLLIHALKVVLAKGIYLPVTALELIRPHSAPLPAQTEANTAQTKLPALTARQMQVLHGVIVGQSNKAIAKSLNLSDATVKAHLTLTFRTLGVSSRTEAIYASAKLGLRLA